MQNEHSSSMSTELVSPAWEKVFIASLRGMIDHVHQNAVKHQFWNEMFYLREESEQFYQDFIVYEKSARLALVHSEISEAIEAARKHDDTPDQHCPEFTNETIELADAMIRIMDYAGRYNLPLAQAIIAKAAFNATRPIKHGKKI